MKTVNFTIDAALLEELGRRLIGKHYIALAELVKNSFDADATEVNIEFEPDSDRIVVSDNGHGMSENEFNQLWMRIGSTHKKKQRISRNFKRVMTGSKGVGRLAVQFLAKKLKLITTPENDLSSQLEASVNWEEAVRAGDLVDATVNYEIIQSNDGFMKGTRIVLTGLRQSWDKEEILGLAREIWQLEPPFRSRFDVIDESEQFRINILTTETEIKDIFDQQLKAILRIWYARIVGKNDHGEVTFSLQFVGEDPINQFFKIPECELEAGDFEIRIYHLRERQPYGISVGVARKYLNNHGGIYVYDGGFQLPFYGDPTNDWLNLERSHSHRISVSSLLPKEMQADIQEFMNFLPTTSRTLGVVNVNTKTEPDLDILITRDRLQESIALQNLREIISWTLHFYALEEKKRNLKLKELESKIKKPKYEKLEKVIEYYKEHIPNETYVELKKDIKKVADEIETESEEIAKRVSIVSALSTAGITSLAYQHETKRQFRTLDELIIDLEKIINIIKEDKIKKTLLKLKNELIYWLERMRTTNNLFAYLSDSENLTLKKRFPARLLIENVIDQIKALIGDVKIDFGPVEYMLLPEASLADWSSIFQNVFVNAINSLLDSEKKLIQVSTRIQGKEREILIQDTGVGVNLKSSDKLFEPFVREIKISKERQALGYGGTGLGLTIVKLLAHKIGCKVAFVKPTKGFKTAFSLKWSEMN